MGSLHKTSRNGSRLNISIGLSQRMSPSLEEMLGEGEKESLTEETEKDIL